MNVVIKVNFFILLGALSVLLSCGRAPIDESTSRITIAFPKSFSPLGNSANSLSALNEISPLSSNWNSITPSTYNDIDCLGVVVFGPEPELRKNYCGKKDGTENFPVGMIVATVAKGQSFTLDVPSGRDRVIRIFGMKLASGSVCPNFLNGQNNDSLMSTMSKPYILGEVGALELKPGEIKNVSVPISTTINSSQYFEDCHGPLFQNGSSTGGNASAPVGTGRDGDVTVSAPMFDLRSTTVPAGPAAGKNLVSIARVTELSVPTTDLNYLRLKVNDASWVGTQQLAIDDEVLLYAAAGDGAGCGSVYPGFTITGFVKAFPSFAVPDYSVVEVLVGDNRWSTISTTNLVLAPTTGSGFCRLVIARVPHINNLVFNANSFVDYNAGNFGSLSSGVHGGGIIYMRVAGTMTAGNNSGFRMSGRGFSAGSYSQYGDSWNSQSAVSVVNGSNGSGGGGYVATSIAPGGGGYGGAGGNGYGSLTGGAIVGDSYGCGSSSFDASMRCLFGKIFLGSAGGSQYDSFGGNGGGLIYVSTNLLNITSGGFLMESNGGVATNSATGLGSGGGSGGSVLLNVNSLNILTGGSLFLEANGSVASANASQLSYAGGGGGGRVHINVNTCSASAGAVVLSALGAPIAANLGTNGSPGGEGSVYVSGQAATTCDSLAVKNAYPKIFNKYPNMIPGSSGGALKLYVRNVLVPPSSIGLYNAGVYSCGCSGPILNGNELSCTISPGTCSINTYEIVVTLPDGSKTQIGGLNIN